MNDDLVNKDNYEQYKFLNEEKEFWESVAVQEKTNDLGITKERI